jgi:hypothetical protein
MNFANPTLEKMARQWFDSFYTNSNDDSFAHSRSHFLFCRREAWTDFG